MEIKKSEEGQREYKTKHTVPAIVDYVGCKTNLVRANVSTGEEAIESNGQGQGDRLHAGYIMLLLKSPGLGASTERQGCVCDGERFEMVWAGVEEGLEAWTI